MNTTQRKVQPNTRGEVVCVIDKATRRSLLELSISREVT